MKPPGKRRLSPQEDVVDVAVAILRAHTPELSAQTLLQFEIELRQRFGGGCEYVRKRPALRNTAALQEALRRGMSVAQASAAIGVARSHGYSLLNRLTNPGGAP